MKLTKAQERVLRHLRAAYVGPDEEDEVVFNMPNLQYAVGMLFPLESSAPEQVEAAAVGGPESDVVSGDVEEDDAGVPLAEEWRPSSVAISFVTSGRTVACDFSAATYEPITDDGPPRWKQIGRASCRERV